MKMKKTVGLLLTAAMAASTMAVPVAAEEPTTLTYLTWTYSDRTASTDYWIQQCLEQYNIKIEMQNVTSDEYATMLKAKLAAEELPDLVSVHSISAQYDCEGTKVSEDTFLDLSEIPGLENFSEDVVNSVKVNGKLYYVPVSQNTVGVLYNKKIFEENNLAIPTNYDEFMALMDSLVELNISPLAGSFADGWSTQIIPFVAFDNWIWREDPEVAYKLYNVSTNESTMRWVDLGDNVISALGLTRSWIDGGYFTEDPLGTDANTACQLLATGQAAMFATGSWEYNVVASASEDPENIGFFALPLNNAEEETILPVSSDEGLCISASSENLDAAKLAMELYLSPEVQTMVAADLGSVSTNNQVEPSGTFVGEIVDVINNCQIATDGFYGAAAKGHMLPRASSFSRADELVSLAGGYTEPIDYCETADAAIAEVAVVK